MGTRKPAAQVATDGASQRPRRSVPPKKSYAQDPSDDADSETTSSGGEEEPRQRGRLARGKQPASTAAAAPSTRRSTRRPATGASTRATSIGRRPATALVARTTARGQGAAARDDDTSGSGSEGDDDQEVDSSGSDEEQVQAAPSRRPTRGTAAGSAAVAAAPATTRGKASGAQSVATAAGAARGTAKAGATARAAGSRSGVTTEDAAASGDEDEDEEAASSDEDEDEEAEAAVPVAAARTRATGGALAHGGKARAPQTSNESRKRLFDLLERRIGSITADASGAGGRRLLYGDLPVKNSNKKAKLLVDLRAQFDDWHSRLRSNFSVLLYGFGSKRGLLEEFAKLLAGPRNRGDAAVLVYHGYNPRCTARDIVTGVASALMQRTFRITGPGGGTATGAGAPAALRALVDEIRSEPLDRHVFVVVHNLDGPGLRRDVSLLSALAACPQVHLIASVDHALAPLLWDSADAARFRWQYINATAFQPYVAETSGMQSVLLGAFKSGVITAGAGTVLRSLVLGAQEVFKVLASYLLEEDDTCEGVAFAHLYRMCRERFLVRDEQVLRQHLVEFHDHQLVRTRPASDDSGELLTVDMGREDLRAVLEDLEEARKKQAA